MKIALISHLYPTKLHPKNGKFIQDHYKLLSEDPDINVDLIVPTPYSFFGTNRYRRNHSPILEKSGNSCRVYYLSFPKRLFPKIIRNSLSSKVINLFKKKNYDLIHIHWLSPDGMTIPSLKKLGYKTVLTVHGSDWYSCIKNPKLTDLIKESFTKTDRLLYSGPLLKKDIESIFPEVSNKSDIIYNMVNAQTYSLPRKEKKSLKLNLGWSPHNKHALTVAHIRNEKGIDLLVESIHGNPDLKDIHFHLVGAIENTTYSKKIVEKIINNKLSNIFIHPPVAPKELIKYYHASDFYVLPSRREGFGLAMIEAASTGLPIVATPTGIAPSFVDEQIGVLCKNFDPELLSISILKLFKTLDSYDPIVSRNKALQKFSNDVFKTKLKSHYTELVSGTSLNSSDI